MVVGLIVGIMIHKSIILILVSTVAAKEGICRALVLSGGGSNGAWEAGVLWGLTHYGNPEDFAYDWISGISLGKH